MGWYDCFDFERNEFTQVDKKAPEIRRVLRNAGRFVCCSWEAQDDLAWMEGAILRHYPEIQQDEEYLERRPIGMAYEKPAGYEIILQAAGFRSIEVSRRLLNVCLQMKGNGGSKCQMWAGIHYWQRLRARTLDSLTG